MSKLTNLFYRFESAWNDLEYGRNVIIAKKFQLKYRKALVYLLLSACDGNDVRDDDDMFESFERDGELADWKEEYA